jgi:4-amino-4-deoxy-L-arabinose transferase-like glycosyltransferase
MVICRLLGKFRGGVAQAGVFAQYRRGGCREEVGQVELVRVAAIRLARRYFDLGAYAVSGFRQKAGGLLVRADAYDVAAAILFLTLIALVAFTFGDYGISNDEDVQQRYGELIVRYYASGMTDQAVFHFRNLYLYGGLFDIIAVGLQKILPLDPYDVRHLLSALTGVGGIAAVWATARSIGGSRAGLLAALALAVCGIWYGAMFNHTKDIPFAAAMMTATYLLLRISRQLPRPNWGLVALFGVACGCAVGLRVLGYFLISYAAVAVALRMPAATGAYAKPLEKWRAASVFAARSALPFLTAFVIAYLIMIVVWPWAHVAPLNPLRGFSAFVDFHYPIQTTLFGHVYHMADVPRWYVPTYIGIKLTLWLLMGAVAALVFLLRPPLRAAATSGGGRRETILVAFAASFPLACEVIADGPAFSGLRHFLFTVPPIAVLAGLGLSALLARLENLHRAAAFAGLALVLLGFGWDATTLYQLHPDEYLYFNPLVGGLAGASRRYDTDYWFNIMPEAVGDLEHFLDRTEGTAGVARPRRHYTVVVCGERLQFEKEADARLEWTKDIYSADFFIAPTNMNCDRYLDGRVIATIERLGVVIGVVKDRRELVKRNIAGIKGVNVVP